jgi:hypothetical protein
MAAPIYHVASAGGNGANVTIATTPPSGRVNRVLYVWVCSGNVADFTMENIPTWSGVQLTEIGTILAETVAVRLFRLIAPDSDGASHNLVVDWVGTMRYAVVAVWMDTLNQTTPNDTVADTSGTGATNANININSGNGDRVVAALVIQNNGDPTFSTGDTEEADVFTAGAGTNPAVSLVSLAGTGSSVNADFAWTAGARSFVIRGFNVNILTPISLALPLVTGTAEAQGMVGTTAGAPAINVDLPLVTAQALAGVSLGVAHDLALVSATAQAQSLILTHKLPLVTAVGSPRPIGVLGGGAGLEGTAELHKWFSTVRRR